MRVSRAEPQPRALVAACGNRSRGDDALGPLVIDELVRRRVGGICAIDLGMRPDRLIDALVARQWETLILVDAVAAPAMQPGQIVELSGSDALELPDRAAGTHGISLVAQLRLAERLGALPRDVALFGVVLESAAIESPPGAALAQRAGDAAGRIVRRVRERARARVTS
jgi:hydrogenase maturation protease